MSITEVCNVLVATGWLVAVAVMWHNTELQNKLHRYTLDRWQREEAKKAEEQRTDAE